MKQISPASLEDLCVFLDSSPTAWHAVQSIEEKLIAHEFKELKEGERWHLQPGKRYFITRNGSSLCAFITPLSAPQRVLLLASHTDSPSFKLKPKPEIHRQKMVLFSVEVYGAPLLSSWLNRDLGLAGRIFYFDQNDRFQQSLVRLEQSPLTIPQLAIHLDREVNDKGLILNRQEHLNILAALEIQLPSTHSYLESLIRQSVDFKQLINSELYLYPLEKAQLIGYQKQMIASYRIDNLVSVHASLAALLEQVDPLEDEIKMLMCWDNEEIGSQTAQGAGSPFLNQILERILLALNQDREDYFRCISQSICLSMDAAHALHPNYMEKHDSQHQPIMGQGVVLKTNAQFRYASDAFSSAPIQALAKKQDLPLQIFVSRNDIPCGTTIGPIHSSLTGMPTVDIGCPQLSMHSCRELMASQDYITLCQLLKVLLKDGWKSLIT